MDDTKAILEWRNDSLTRNNSFTKDKIDYETHFKWFSNKLSDKDCFFYILMGDDERLGQLRIDRVDNIGEISYTIAPNKRNNGYGKKIIELLESVDLDNIKVLMGLVEMNNEPSKKCFISNGYSEFIGGIACYIKTL